MTPIKTKRFILPQILRLAVTAAVILVGVWYVGYQARFLITGPQLSLVNEPSIVQGERVIRLQGQARNITAIYLNGRAIATDNEGKFDEGVVLENGYTIVSLDARDRYGRKVHIERPFVYVAHDKTARERELSFSN